MADNKKARSFEVKDDEGNESLVITNSKGDRFTFRRSAEDTDDDWAKIKEKYTKPSSIRQFSDRLPKAGDKGTALGDVVESVVEGAKSVGRKVGNAASEVVRSGKAITNEVVQNVSDAVDGAKTRQAEREGSAVDLSTKEKRDAAKWEARSAEAPNNGLPDFRAGETPAGTTPAGKVPMLQGLPDFRAGETPPGAEGMEVPMAQRVTEPAPGGVSGLAGDWLMKTALGGNRPGATSSNSEVPPAGGGVSAPLPSNADGVGNASFPQIPKDQVQNTLRDQQTSAAQWGKIKDTVDNITTTGMDISNGLVKGVVNTGGTLLDGAIAGAKGLAGTAVGEAITGVSPQFPKTRPDQAPGMAPEVAGMGQESAQVPGVAREAAPYDTRPDTAKINEAQVNELRTQAKGKAELADAQLGLAAINQLASKSLLENQTIVENELSQARGHAADVVARAQKLDPTLIGDRRSTGQKVLGTLAAALYGFAGKGLDYMKQVRAELDADVRQQEAEYAGKRSALNDEYKAADNEFARAMEAGMGRVQSIQMAKLAGLAEQKAFLDSIDYTNMSQDMLAKADTLRAGIGQAMQQVQQQSELLAAQIGHQKAATQATKAGIEIQRFQAETARQRAQGGAQQDKVVTEVDDRVANMRRNINQARKLILKSGTAELFGADQAELNKALSDIAIDGAKLKDPKSVARPSEVDSEQKSLGFKAGDRFTRDDTALKLLDNMERDIDARRAEAYKARGLSAPSAGSSSQDGYQNADE